MTPSHEMGSRRSRNRQISRLTKGDLVRYEVYVPGQSRKLWRPWSRLGANHLGRFADKARLKAAPALRARPPLDFMRPINGTRLCREWRSQYLSALFSYCLPDKPGLRNTQRTCRLLPIELLVHD